MSEKPSILPYFDLKIDWRPFDTLHAVSVLKKFLEVMEEQIHDIEVNEISSLETELPPGNDIDERFKLRANEDPAFEFLFGADPTS